MRIKFAKQRTAFFMPWDNDIRDIPVRWVEKLRDLGWTDKDPMFPQILPGFAQPQDLLGLEPAKEPIKSDTTIRDIFKRTFLAAGLPYYHPHTFRHTIARWAEKNGSPEFFNAVSKSLGHSNVNTTFYTYGEMSPAQIGRALKNNPCQL
jgi:integrase